MKNYFRYILIAVFFASITVIVFLQFNSNKNVNLLIESNEDLLKSQRIKAEMQELQEDIFALDAKTRTFIIRGEKNDERYKQLLAEAEEIRDTQNNLKILEREPALEPYLEDLKTLINRKLVINRQLLDTFNLKGKPAAEQMIYDSGGGRLSDSISVLGAQINKLHEQYSIAFIDEADSKGERAKVFSSILAVLAILTSILTFSYVSLKIAEQRKMIFRLNISEQKARESAVIKEQFLANMSHEIRTPLNAILGFTGLLKKEKLNETTDKYVNFIYIAGDNLLKIVNDILDTSKIEAGMITIESAPFNFRECVEKVTPVYEEKAAEKGLELITNINPAIPDYLKGDVLRLSQILTNLIGNALKFTNEGKVIVDCTLKEQDEKSVQLSIKISDTGVGIKQDQLQNIFERFHQSDKTIQRKYGGTGLGLAIVKDLTKLMNGEVDVKSTENVGTVFTLLIPFEIAESIKNNATQLIDENAVFDTSEKVLVAEDNEINRSLMTHLLTSWKIKHDIVEDGKTAIEKLRQNNYALILMDIQMPEMDGHSATTYIRQELNKTIPIIAMTAHAMPGEKERCIRYGMNNYISKPIDTVVLKNLLASYLPYIKTKEQNMAREGKNYAAPLFKYIDTGYLKSISLGNKEYEKAVTEQFIEAVPAEMIEMQKAAEQTDLVRIKEIAHNLKTTVSIMGILPLVQNYLDELEHKTITQELFEKNYTPLSFICDASVLEAKTFLKQF